VGVGWGTSLLGLGLGLWLVFNGAALRTENPLLQKDLARFEKEPISRIMPKDMPTTKDFSNLRERLTLLNGLGAGAGDSLGQTLARLESLMPPGVRMVSFQSDRESGEIELTAEARSLDEMSGFLAALEKSEYFSKVSLSKQNQSASGEGNWVQFSLDIQGAGP
ncbi:MAG: PilN domain-containing protein, partial [bacterium]